MANSSAFNTVVNIFAAPAEAFAAIRERPRAWLPLLILLVGISAVSFTYMRSVDLPWFIDAQVQQGSANLTAEQRQQAVDAALRLSPVTYGAIGTVTSSLFVLLLTSLTALYYTGVSFVTSDGVTFKQWFGLIAWCGLPAILGIGAQIVNLSASDVRFMTQDAINPLSFGNLLSIDRSGATILQRILLGVDVSALWTLVLSVLGYQAWTKSSLVRTVAIVLGPLALIVVIGTALAFV